jgi:hypothetical protein
MNFRGGYQPRNNLVKDEKGDLVDSLNILNRWKNYFSQSLNVQRVSDVRQVEIHIRSCALVLMKWKLPLQS